VLDDVRECDGISLMPGDREILDGRYGPSTLLRPLERSKLNRLGRLWNLTDRQIEDLETSLIDSFRGAELEQDELALNRTGIPESAGI